MKRQMLILFGPGNVGKSTTIKIAFESFLKWLVNRHRPLSVHYLYLTGREVAAVLEAEGGCVGVATRGDSERHVKEALDFFARYKCRVVLCATRSGGRPLKLAQEFASSELGVIPLEMSKRGAMEDRGEEENREVADKLLRWLKGACCKG